MLKKRRIVGLATGLAVAVTAALLPSTVASAAEAYRAPSQGELPAIPKEAKKFAVPHKKLPAGARRATKGPEAPGARARLFQSPRTGARIVGGAPVRSADFPSVVGLQTIFIGADENGNEGWYISTCTGTVIDPTHVLTAGHCTVDFPWGTTSVIAGRDDLSNQAAGFVARVSNTWTHQGYNYQDLLNDPNAVPLDDVAVLTLKDALPSAYTPQQLADQGAADPAGGTPATIVGYGVTDENNNDSGILRAGAVQIAADSTCASTAQWGTKFDPNRMMCAGLPPTTDTCFGDSGGPIFTGAAGSYLQVGITDWGSSNCGAKLGVFEALNHYSDSVRAQLSVVGPNNLDWTGDGHSDLFGRIKDTGELYLGSGAGLANRDLTGFSYFGYASESNWNNFTKLFRVNNWDGDGRQAVFARDSAGRLFKYRSDGQGGFVGGQPAQIGNGWNAYTDIMVTSNWLGDGRPNLMGRTSDGRLVLYTSNGSGGWLNPRGTQIGTRWNKFNTVLTPGSWLGDGHQSLIGRTPGGELRLYNSNGAGGWINPEGTAIGSGWGGFSTFMSPGDWNGDNLVDLVGVRTNGDLKLYTTNGHGGWLNSSGRQISSGWDDFNLVF
ncbi:trypsin-like serine protease [Actinoplanes sp. NPDC049265]|uniref:trypsin-like serine protease n=1 Tax=Actinoplanes sp. NPDC049265 TaxID=3363902 RepID=UPI00371BF643